MSENKIAERLQKLYQGRAALEQKLVVSLRYNTEPHFIKETIISLSEYRGRVQELEYLLSAQTIRDIKIKLNITE